MRWLGFAICAGMGLTLQTTVAWRLQIGPARPDWMLVLMVFFALHARSEEGLIAGCVLGLLSDLMSIERVGLLAMLYGLSALVLFLVRDYFFIDHPLTHFFLTWVAALGVGLACCFYRSVFGPAGSSGWAFSTFEVMLGAAYTGLWAIPAHRVLGYFPKLLGVRVFRSGARGRALRPKHV